MKNKIIVGTRASTLALTQTQQTCAMMFNAGIEYALNEIVTEGDKEQKKTFSEFGRQSLFSKELDEALLNGECDLAVHSFKDLTGAMPDGLELVLLTNEVQSNDCFVSEKYNDLSTMPDESVVGTSSIRRYSILKKHFPHLKIKPIRGNIDTRVKKMQSGEYEGIILAKAGLVRMNKVSLSQQVLAKDLFTPPLGQGLIAVVMRENDKKTKAALNLACNIPFFSAVMTLKKTISDYEGGCSLPLGVDVNFKKESLHVMTYLGDAVNNHEIRFKFEVNAYENQQLEKIFKENMHKFGAEKICKIMKDFSIPYEKE